MAAAAARSRAWMYGARAAPAPDASGSGCSCCGGPRAPVRAPARREFCTSLLVCSPPGWEPARCFCSEPCFCHCWPVSPPRTGGGGGPSWALRSAGVPGAGRALERWADRWGGREARWGLEDPGLATPPKRWRPGALGRGDAFAASSPRPTREFPRALPGVAGSQALLRASFWRSSALPSHERVRTPGNASGLGAQVRGPA